MIDVVSLEAAFDKASSKIKSSLTATKGGAQAEANYAAAYAALVSVDARPKLKRKYR